MGDSLKDLVSHMEECCTDRKRSPPWYYSNCCSDEMYLCSRQWKPSQTNSRAAGISMQWMAAPSQDPSLGSRCLAGSSATLMQCFHFLLCKWLRGGWAERWLGTPPAAAEHVLS